MQPNNCILNIIEKQHIWGITVLLVTFHILEDAHSWRHNYKKIPVDEKF